jgi:hypothetical protein
MIARTVSSDMSRGAVRDALAIVRVLTGIWLEQVLRISGYIADEKVHIARQYLEPATRKESGIPEGSSSLTDKALRTLITESCRFLSRAP